MKIKKCKADIKLFDSNILYIKEKENKMLDPTPLPTFSLNNSNLGFMKKKINQKLKHFFLIEFLEFQKKFKFIFFVNKNCIK